MNESLSPWDKSELMARFDNRHRDEYDQDFFNALMALREPALNDIEDKARRAIARFIEVMEKGLASVKYPPGSYLLEGFILGWLAGKTIPRSIFKEGKEPKKP